MNNGHSPDLVKETRRLLRERKISQAQVSEGSGVSQKWVSLLERGRIKNPGYKNLAKVFDFLSQSRVAA